MREFADALSAYLKGGKPRASKADSPILMEPPKVEPSTSRSHRKRPSRRVLAAFGCVLLLLLLVGSLLSSKDNDVVDSFAPKSESETIQKKIGPTLAAGLTDPVFSVAFSPDSRWIVSGGAREDEEAGELKVWDVSRLLTVK